MPSSESAALKMVQSVDTLAFTYQVPSNVVERFLSFHSSPDTLPPGFELGDGIPRYGLGLIADGIMLNVGESEKLSPNCYIKFKSEFIQRLGLQGAYERLCQVLERLGFPEAALKTEKVSTVHLAYDFNADLGRYLMVEQFRARTKKYKKRAHIDENDRITYMLWGVGAASGYKVRIYDKLLEVEEVQGKDYWYAIWQDGGLLPSDHIWRVEYEVKRDLLKSWEVDSFDSLLEVLPSLSRRLIELFSIVEVNQVNINRCPMVPEFQLIYGSTRPYSDYKVDTTVDQLLKNTQLAKKRTESSVLRLLASFVALDQASTGNPDELLQSIENHTRSLLNLVTRHLDASTDALVEMVSDALSSQSTVFKPVEVVHG